MPLLSLLSAFAHHARLPERASGRAGEQGRNRMFTVFSLLISPMNAALAMDLSSVSIVGKALRLAKIHL